MVFKGIFPAMFTVWDEGDNYNPEASETYVDWLIANGVEGLAVTGSTGEMTAMPIDVQKEVIEHVVRYAAGKVPVLASVGKYDTDETLELAATAKDAGADGLMVILPYYYKPYKAAAVRHLKEVSEAIGLPITLYNNPNFSGYELTPREVAALYAEGTISSIKSAHGDASRIADLKALCDISTFYGHDYGPFGAFACGADGWLSGFPAAFPKQCRALQDAVRDRKDLAEGSRIWKHFYPIVEMFMDPAVNAEVHWLEMLKFAVEYQGVPVGKPRRPLQQLDPAYQRKMVPLIDELQKI